jgi:hypothetical protein
MASNLHIDQKLLAKAVNAAGNKSKRETVNQALEEFVRYREQLKILDLIGTLEDDAFWDPPKLPQSDRTARNGKPRRNGKRK